AFALVDDLIDACAEGGHVRERQHGAADLVLTICVRRYSDNEPPVPVAKIGSRLYSGCHDLAALLFETRQAGETRDIARRSTDVRWGEAKLLCRRLVEAGDREVASHDNDRKFNRVEDVGQIGRSRACVRIVTVEGSETDPAASGRDRLSSHFR